MLARSLFLFLALLLAKRIGSDCYVKERYILLYEAEIDNMTLD